MPLRSDTYILINLSAPKTEATHSICPIISVKIVEISRAGVALNGSPCIFFNVKTIWLERLDFAS